ncbi:MAG: DegT/DnrJ/EryC1/StrS family aminotransferase [Lachnospiraceae bacterium]|jgi:dTDP-4-amino-4,6-dideoxygalactose transaminase|nr:DegT/DnrJ/EryC1/StrS family aminotransferase [Lachnospiraceae bacterium]
MDEKIFVTKPSLPPMEEYMEMVKDIWKSRYLTNWGKYVRQFMEELKAYFGMEYCMPMCNGHMALEMVLQAMELHGEIITTPFTFASTTHAIVRSGCTPVFCDIKESDGTIDEEKIEALITEKTVAILPVHVYGFPCNVERIEAIAKKHGLKVIYDAAHAFGMTVGGKSIATYGDASMFSFHATKAFHTIEGGCVALHDKEEALRVYQLSNFGIMNEEEVAFVGANAKMNEFEAAMGLCNLKHFEEYRTGRKEAYDIYRTELSGIPGVRMLTAYREDVVSNYAYCPVLFDAQTLGVTRDDVKKHLEEHNVFTRKYFYPLTNSFDCYKEAGFQGKTPVAERVASQVLTLPLYSDLAETDVFRICELIKEAMGIRR